MSHDAANQDRQATDPVGGQRKVAARHVVATTAEVPDGSRKLVEIEGRKIVLINSGGEFFAILNRCPHQGGDLVHGSLVGLVEADQPGAFCHSRPGEILRCAWHGWEFDIRTGQSWCNPRTRVRTYATAVEEGACLARGPIIAETFTVSVADQYVLIEI